MKRCFSVLIIGTSSVIEEIGFLQVRYIIIDIFIHDGYHISKENIRKKI